MKTTHKELTFESKDKLTFELFTERSIFFDIETTGFSSAYTNVYLIGCAYRLGNMIYIDQFFADSVDEEKFIITSFLELIKQYNTIITYNGIGFDIPYLKARCNTLGINEFFSDFAYIDIFKSISKLKHIFKLPNYKQKSIEYFLDITRNDLYSGGELIQIYHDYSKELDNERLSFLLLHNYEDVLGMIDLLPILSYMHLFQGEFINSTVSIDKCKDYNGSIEKELILSITPKFSFPKRVSYGFENIYFTCFKNTAKISIRIIENNLKYFFPNYSDYYYLPKEDFAIHKSVASSVDKKFRIKAKASTCYVKKNGCFLPQYKHWITPSFKLNYSDKTSYFELTEDFMNNSELINSYITHLLSTIIMHKK